MATPRELSRQVSPSNADACVPLTSTRHFSADGFVTIALDGEEGTFLLSNALLRNISDHLDAGEAVVLRRSIYHCQASKCGHERLARFLRTSYVRAGVVDLAFRLTALVLIRKSIVIQLSSPPLVVGASFSIACP
jgi:hypothetical protein